MPFQQNRLQQTNLLSNMYIVSVLPMKSWLSTVISHVFPSMTELNLSTLEQYAQSNQQNTQYIDQANSHNTTK